MSPILKQAYEIAANSLRRNYTPSGLQAGVHNFDEIWTRDCAFASFGCVSLADTEIVRASIRSLLKHTRSDGQVPLRIGDKYYVLKYLGLYREKNPKGVYIEDKYVSKPVDCNSLLIIMAHHLIKTTQDFVFLNDIFQQLTAVMHWHLQLLGPDLLLSEGHYANWMDSIKRKGKILYTNILSYYASTCMAELATWAQNSSYAEQMTQTARLIKSEINTQFWTGQYYRDWIPVKKTSPHFAVEANALAIIFGIADQESAKQIQSYAENHHFSHDFCPANQSPPYPKHMSYFPFRFLNLSDYHTHMKWLWVGCVDAIAKHHANHPILAEKSLTKLAEIIIKHNGVYEVYEPEGRPVNRLFYTSDKHWAWSAGTFIWALHECGLT